MTCTDIFRYKPGQVYLEKDLILPYVPNVDLCDRKCLTDGQSKRNVLLFFRGRLKRNAVSFGQYQCNFCTLYHFFVHFLDV